MQDILLNRTLRLVIVGMVALLCLAGLVLCYQALLEMTGGNFAGVAQKLAWGLSAGVASLLLGRYRDDLIDT